MMIAQTQGLFFALLAIAYFLTTSAYRLAAPGLNRRQRLQRAAAVGVLLPANFFVAALALAHEGPDVLWRWGAFHWSVRGTVPGPAVSMYTASPLWGLIPVACGLTSGSVTYVVALLRQRRAQRNVGASS